jgi:hypothetical protein
MALRYTFKDIEIKSNDRIRKGDLNRRYKKLVQNDSTMFPNGKIPGIWERRWLNNDNVEGYSKGDSVWINTEDRMRFLVGKASEIYNYAIMHPILSKRITKLDTMDPNSIKLYLDIMDGFTDKTTGTYIPCLYWLGDLKKPVQIRVCTGDNVKATPDDDRYWKNFFIPNDKNEEILEEAYKTDIERAIENHYNNYHSDASFDDIEDVYIRNDMSNIPAASLQRYNRGMTRRKTMKGFDYIRYSATRVFPGGSTRWFRMWNSGYLEHGGTIVQKSMSPYEANEYDGKAIVVKFAWETEEGSYAPEYEYPGLGIDSFYPEVNMILETGISYDNNGNIGPDNRYNVSVSPMMPIDDFDTAMIFTSLPNISVNTMKNSSFVFTTVPGCPTYSFTVSGWTVSKVSTMDTHKFLSKYVGIDDQDHSGSTSKLMICIWKSDMNSVDDTQIDMIPATGGIDLYNYYRDLSSEGYLFAGWYLDGGTWKNPIPSSYDSETGTRKCMFTPTRGSSVVHARYLTSSELANVAFDGSETSITVSNSITMSGEFGGTAAEVFVEDGDLTGA